MCIYIYIEREREREREAQLLDSFIVIVAIIMVINFLCRILFVFHLIFYGIYWYTQFYDYEGSVTFLFISILYYIKKKKTHMKLFPKDHYVPT